MSLVYFWYLLSLRRASCWNKILRNWLEIKNALCAAPILATQLPLHSSCTQFSGIPSRHLKSQALHAVVRGRERGDTTTTITSTTASIFYCSILYFLYYFTCFIHLLVFVPQVLYSLSGVNSVLSRCRPCLLLLCFSWKFFGLLTQCSEENIFNNSNRLPSTTTAAAGLYAALLLLVFLWAHGEVEFFVPGLPATKKSASSNARMVYPNISIQVYPDFQLTLPQRLEPFSSYFSLLSSPLFSSELPS